MKLQDFDYNLPEALIAQHPLKRRDQARLLVIDRETATISHDIFKNVDQYLPTNSHLVLNNSKVIPARLFGQRKDTGGKIELFILKQRKDDTYEVLLKPLKRLKVNDEIVFGNGIKATLIDRENRIVRFNRKNILKHLENIGHIPLPPYINRNDTKDDRKYYQTVFAKKLGSVASPTAALHFTKPLLNRIKKKVKSVEEVTLHVNYGTFKPVEEKNITQHKMHSENYSLTKSSYTKLKKAKVKNEPIVAVGTTSARVLETVVKCGTLAGSTDIFIYPGYSFQWVDILITNFHLPRSTLLMLVYAFGGNELMKKAYQEAIKNKYRFYSYGDSMIII